MHLRYELSIFVLTAPALPSFCFHFYQLKSRRTVTVSKQDDRKCSTWANNQYESAAIQFLDRKSITKLS